MSTNILSLDRAIQNTILWLNEIQEELRWDDRDMTYKATKAVLQAIRDRVPFEEVVHFSANLPMVMKGMMMDGYDLSGKPLKIRNIEDFYDCVQDNYDAQRRSTINPDDALRGVINVLSRRIGGGEMGKIASIMPEKLRPLFGERGPEQAARAGRKRTTKSELEIPQT